MWNSRRTCATCVLAGILVAFGSASAQQRSPVLPPDTVEAVSKALQEYTAVDNKLAQASVLDATALSGHWRQLRSIRVRLDKLEARNLLDKQDKTTAALKKEIVSLLDHPVHINISGDGPGEVRLRRAQDLRLIDLVAIARLGNRRFGLDIRSVLGMPIDAGVV